MPDELSVRQWQEKFRTGAFDSNDLAVQCEAGWHDWFCQDQALARRLKKIGKVVMGITAPFILDNYYVWFKNNQPLEGPLYDDARFEPLSGERGGKYFAVSLDSPHERKKWALTTERYGFNAPEFDCWNIRDMIQYINRMGWELAQDTQPGFLREKQAVAAYLQQCNGTPPGSVYREGPHLYSYYRGPRSVTSKRLLTAYTPETLPSTIDTKDMKKVGGIYIFDCGAVDPFLQDLGRKGGRRRKEPER